MAKVQLWETFFWGMVPEYPECPYAGGDKKVDCTHPKRSWLYCATHHHSGEDCPFDLRKELYGVSKR